MEIVNIERERDNYALVALGCGLRPYGRKTVGGIYDMGGKFRFIFVVQAPRPPSHQVQPSRANSASQN